MWGPIAYVDKHRRLRDRALPLAVVALATLSSIATSPARETPSAAVTETVTLSADSPVVVRHYTWTVAGGEPAPTGAVLTASAEGSGLTETTLLPDDPALASLVVEPAGASKRELDLGEGCAGGCTGGTLVILHLPSDSPVLEQIVELSATIVPTCRGRCAMPQIREDANKAFTGKPTTLTTGRVILQRIQVDPGVAEQSVSFVLHLDAAALGEPITALRGTMRAAVGLVDGDQRFGTDQIMTVGAIPPFEIDPRARDIDWLAECQAGRDCAIPLQLHLRTVAGRATDPSGSNALPAQADIYDWWISVTLEAYDLRALPEDAIRIESE